jgi:very-short-patch-repair endonuclease
MTCLQYLTPMSRLAATDSLLRIWRSPSTSPFLPVLLGEPEICRRVWSDACCRENDHGCLLKLSDDSVLLDLCATAVLENVDLYQTSLEILASTTQLPLPLIQRKTFKLSLRQIVTLFESCGKPCSPAVTAVASCCIYSKARCSEDSSTLISAMREECGNCFADSTVLAALVEVAGPAWRSPILCEFYGHGDAEPDHLVINLRTILSACLESSAVRIGLAMSAYEYDLLLNKVQSTFLTSALREHVFALLPGQTSEASTPTNDATEAKRTSQQAKPYRGNVFDQDPDQAAPSDRETESTILDQLRRSLPAAKDQSGLLESAKAVLQAAQRCEIPEARSLAESFLYDLLNARAETTGLFALNQKMNFTFGSRAAEIDLCCVDLRIAIEVDGHYHFSQPESYRRDRRKDLLLQCENYLVLRFLAEDVVAQMSDILETIIDAIAWRRSRKSSLTNPAQSQHRRR